MTILEWGLLASTVATALPLSVSTVRRARRNAAYAQKELELTRYRDELAAYADRLSKERVDVEALRAEVDAERKAVVSEMTKARATIQAEREAATTSLDALKDAWAERETLERQRLDQDAAVLRRDREELSAKIASAISYDIVWYKVFIIGVVGTGKTTLAKSWQNPMFNPKEGGFAGTTYSRYDVHVKTHLDKAAHLRTDHRFHIFDFGGEHLVRALDVLRDQRPEVLICVLDIELIESSSPGEGSVVDPGRTKAQIERFTSILEFFFRGRGGRNFRRVMFVVNKVDLLSVQPEIQVARGLEVFTDLRRYVDQFEGVREKCSWHAISVNTGVGVREAFGDLLHVLPPDVLLQWESDPPEIDPED